MFLILPQANLSQNNFNLVILFIINIKIIKYFFIFTSAVGTYGTCLSKRDACGFPILNSQCSGHCVLSGGSKILGKMENGVSALDLLCLPCYVGKSARQLFYLSSISKFFHYGFYLPISKIRPKYHYKEASRGTRAQVCINATDWHFSCGFDSHSRNEIFI